MPKEQVNKPRNDAYTGLLAVSFLALVGATVLMALDAQELGTAPGAFKVDVPGATPGKAGDALKKADPGKIDVPAPMGPPMMPPMMPPAPMMMRNDPPAKLPAIEIPDVVVPTSATTKNDDTPPLPVAPFVPPM